MQKLDPDEARTIVKTHVCSDCWGGLIDRYLPKERLSEVTCVTDGCPCNGFVSARFVERRLQEQQAEAMEARYALREVIRAGGPKKTLKELIEELGI